ncbi:hypothetical protein B566_EDAN008629, partial [Ephemera danica]
MTTSHGVCDFSCGWLAGVCGLIVGHPADTIKVRQQTLGGISAWRCAVATVKYEGTNPDTAQHPLSKVFLAGCVGGISQVGVSCSVDLVKIKLQAQTGTSQTWGVHYEAGYRGPFDCLVGVVRADGLKGMFRGLLPTLY